MDVARATAALQQTQNAAATDASKRTESSKKTGGDYGKTLGEPKLSDKAAEYYKQLKEKFGDMEFILVSKDEVANAKQNAAKYARADKTVVLIDEENIERMANDESFRKNHENAIESAKNQLSQMAEKFGDMSSVKGFGMQLESDGSTSFFAVTQKNNEEMVQKLQEKRTAKKEAAKKAAKKAQKEAAAEKLEEKRTEKRQQDKDAAEKLNEDDGKVREREWKPEDYEIITAKSAEELIHLVENHELALRSDSVMTEAETYVGGSIDLKL